MTAAETIALVARGALAGTFAVSAVAKLRDRPATQSALRSMGLPANLDLTLALVEGFTAFGLLMERRTPWAALVALALLVLFTGFVVRQLITGNSAPCPCFGAGTGSSPTSLRTLARNLGLVAIAVVATGTTGSGAPGRWVVWVIAAVTAVAISAWTAAAARSAR